MTKLAEVMLPGAPLSETVAFFCERLGLRLCSIQPADEPQVAVLEGCGLRLRLDACARGDAGVLRVDATADEQLIAPNGTRVLMRRPEALRTPPASGDLTVVSAPRATDWTVGRAGMLYRDLIPGRLGGHVVASHIRIPRGGPVPDDVHFHDVAVQVIHCVRGWVRLVYEGQGASFVLRAGQTVLQPPRIRHRVLECSDALEVVEVTSPAQHLTTIDYELPLPSASVGGGRDFDGQRFVVQTLDGPDRIADSSGERVAVSTFSLTEEPRTIGADARVDLVFALQGSAELHVAGDRYLLEEGGAATTPPGVTGAVRGSDGGAALHVQLAVHKPE